MIPKGRTREALDGFVLDATTPDDLHLVTSPGFAAVVVIDSEAGEALADAGPESDRWANWAVVQAGPISLVRLDIVKGEKTRLKSWLIGSPAPEIVRATSAGPHVVVVLTEPFPRDRAAIQRVVQEGTAFPVRTAPDAMRILRSTILSPEGT